MMVIRRGWLSCDANSDGKGKGPLVPQCANTEESCRADVYSYKQNPFADTVETFKEEPLFFFLCSQQRCSHTGSMMESVWHNYWRQLAGRRDLQMYWGRLLWGVWFILTPRGEERDYREESKSFASNKGFNLWRKSGLTREFHISGIHLII